MFENPHQWRLSRVFCQIRLLLNQIFLDNDAKFCQYRRVINFRGLCRENPQLSIIQSLILTNTQWLTSSHRTQSVSKCVSRLTKRYVRVQVITIKKELIS